jgi:uncharacterized membrane protein YphA (DoxX/SURF4 family)
VLSLGAAVRVPMYRHEMQRLFTMFPAGLPGLALVLLRIGVTGSLWGPTLGNGLQNVLPLFGLGIVSALLLAGIATPLAASLAAIIQLVTILDRARMGVLIPTEVHTLAIQGTSALALALLGPGAFSVDARLFGRKILTSSRPGSR